MKSAKDKSHPATPKLAPRATAASTARAARNATNRNLTTPVTNRLSPSRTPQPVNKAKVTNNVRTSPVPKTDSKEVFRNNRNCEPADDILDTDYFTSSKQDINPEPKEDATILIISETSKEDTIIDQEICENSQEVHETIIEIKEENEIEEENNLQDFTTKVSTKMPQTPCISRPDTPKSVYSRPQTPRLSSRPTTPSQNVQRVSIHSSRPNTPQKSSDRPQTPSSITLPPPIRSQTPSLTGRIRSPNKDNAEDIKVSFIAKQRQYNRMKKELDLKQQAVLEVYECLRDLRERMPNDGAIGGGEGVQDLVLINVADWATEEVAQLCHETTCIDDASELFNITIPIDEGVLSELDARVMDVPKNFADLCLQAFNTRQELIDWVKELIENSESGQREFMERIARYNTEGLELCEALRELKNRASCAVDTVTQISKRTCRERSALISVGESLVREVARLRQDLEARNELLNEVRQSSAENDNTKAFEELRKELEEERNSKQTIRDKLTTTETQLRQARIRINKMDKQLREAEASITSLTSTVKSLEDQSRQREVQLEARARKLKESLKTGEVASSQISQQRDSLQVEVQNLKEELEKITTQHKATVLDLTNKIKELKAALDEQLKETQKEAGMRQNAETALLETQNNLQELRNKITELEISKPNPDLPTEREMDLWAELQATKETLRMTEEEVTANKREKLRFLESFTKLAESENKAEMQQKLAAELLAKEEILCKMQNQVRELTKNIKLNEQKVLQYEQYVRDLQAHNRAVANCQEAPNGISYQDLQQEIMNLRMSLLEAVHRNEEVSELLVQKEQQLEQQDKTSRAQARVIKVREELINMLKNKETEQSRDLCALQQDLEHRMKIVDDVNKQIAAKADEIQELFATLENKQQQIHRLEKIVLALEEQQRRAQAQRTRHEEKIAALEHELAATGNKKFLFF